MANDQLVSLRLPSEMVRRLDAVAVEAERDPENAAWRVSRGAMIRLALIEGLKVLEQRYQVRPPARRVRRVATPRGDAK